MLEFGIFISVRILVGLLGSLLGLGGGAYLRVLFVLILLVTGVQMFGRGMGG